MAKRFFSLGASTALVAGALFVGFLSPPARASGISEFTLPGQTEPGSIVSGPDGNLWFVDGGTNKIGRITPAGVITEFPLPSATRLTWSGADIARGPDGNLWFTEYSASGSGVIARISPAGAITEFPLSATDGNPIQPLGITTGPDGNLWFTAFNLTCVPDCRLAIGRITPVGEASEFPLSTPNSSGGFFLNIASGPDGNLWFTEGKNSIGKITPSGVITEFPLSGYADTLQIVSGPDGNLWFTETGSFISRITPSGVISKFPLPSVADRQPERITRGPDGNLWFTESSSHAPGIGRITPTGTITEFPLPAGDDVFDLGGITAGADGKLWFTERTFNGGGKIGTFATTLTVPIEPSFSGAWFDPAQSGHGFFIEVLSDNRFLAWWFTFAPDGGQAWFGGVGTYSGNTATITEVAQTTGGRFIPNFDPTKITETLWGTLRFTFDDCNHGRVDFDSIVGYGRSFMELTRLTQIDGTTCPHSGIPPTQSTSSAVTEYQAYGSTSITSGPDGNLWFTEGKNSIGKITPSGVSEDFPLPATDTPPNSNIVAGPDGHLWFVEGGLIFVCANPQLPNTCKNEPVELRVGKIAPSGAVQDFVFPSDGRIEHGIARGPDGNLWYTTGNSIARITPNGVATEFALPSAGSSPYTITSGPDGNLWFTEITGNKIGRITTSGRIDEFALPEDASSPTTIINGPDGNLWFIGGSQKDSYGFLEGSRIGKITPSGVIAEFAPPGGVTGITSGPDGNIWFTEFSTDKIGKITPAGEISEMATLSSYSGPTGITSGPDGKLWFTESGASGGKVGTFSSALTVPLGGGFSGAWFDPAQSGHGFFIEVLSDNRFLAWWFTFAPDGGQAWFGGVGTYSGNTATITEVAQTTGGRFIPNFDPTKITQTLWGTLRFTFDDCNHGRVDFDSIVGYGSGSMALTRLTQIADTTCP